MLRHPFWRVDFALELWICLWARGVLGVVSPSFCFMLAGHTFHSDQLSHSLTIPVRMHFPLTTPELTVVAHTLYSDHFVFGQTLPVSGPGTSLGPIIVRGLSLRPKVHSYVGGVSNWYTGFYVLVGGSVGILGGWGLRNPPHWRTFTQTLV